MLDSAQPRGAPRGLVLMGPRVLDLGVFQLTLLSTTNLASRLDAGSVSALEWGWDAMQLPETIIGTAFGLVAFPTLAELAARHDLAGLRHTLGETMRAVIALTVPAAVGLILLGPTACCSFSTAGRIRCRRHRTPSVRRPALLRPGFGRACLPGTGGPRLLRPAGHGDAPVRGRGHRGTEPIGAGLVLMGPLGHGGLALANSLAVSAGGAGRCC